MRRSIKKFFKCVMILVTTALIAKIGYELKWFDVIMGIVKIEAKEKPVQKVSFKALSFISKADHEIDFLIEMKNRGWEFVKHYGRGMIFEKEGYEILISKKVFWGRYAFYEVTTKEIFDVI